jgi:hypothetical protein
VGQTIDIRRFVKRTAVTTQIGVAQVVGENKDEIGLLGGYQRGSASQHDGMHAQQYNRDVGQQCSNIKDTDEWIFDEHELRL